MRSRTPKDEKTKTEKGECKYWAQPISNTRLSLSLSVTLYPKLRDRVYRFVNYFGLSIKSFDDLLESVSIQRHGFKFITHDGLEQGSSTCGSCAASFIFICDPRSHFEYSMYFSYFVKIRTAIKHRYRKNWEICNMIN